AAPAPAPNPHQQNEDPTPTYPTLPISYLLPTLPPADYTPQTLNPDDYTYTQGGYPGPDPNPPAVTPFITVPGTPDVPKEPENPGVGVEHTTTIYELAIITYAVAWLHFMSEWWVFGSARWGRGLAGPVVVANGSLGWMVVGVCVVWVWVLL
ncbi:hypothetical protein HYFRA_00008165, partial [Hymenoscyphus fraxineus]